MNINELIEKAEQEGLSSLAKHVKENYVEEEVPTIIAAVRGALEKSANFLKIEINEDHGDMRVHCPLFDKNVEIEDTCYGCRYNPGTGRWEGKGGEYFQCNYNPAVDVQVWPATRTIQSPTKSSMERIRKEGQKLLDKIDEIIESWEEEDAENVPEDPMDANEEYAIVIYYAESKDYVEDSERLTTLYNKENAVNCAAELAEEIRKLISSGKWEPVVNEISVYDNYSSFEKSFPIKESSSKKMKKEAVKGDISIPVLVLYDEDFHAATLHVSEQVYDNQDRSQFRFIDAYAGPYNVSAKNSVEEIANSFETDMEFVPMNERIDEEDKKNLESFVGKDFVYWVELDNSIESSSKKIKKAQSGVIETVEQSQQNVLEKQVSLPDQEDLSRFNNLSKEELENQLRMYTDLNEVLADAPPGENIKLQDTIAIIEHITELLGKTPETLENNDTVIEEVKEEDLDALREKMHTDYDESEINEVAASLSKKKIPLNVVSKKEAEEEASRLGFIKLESLTKEAPAILDRCVKKVLAEHKGDKNFTKSNAYAICISNLRDKHPSVEKWVHKKKTEVNKMKKIEDAKMSELTVPDLKARLQALNDAEFVVRSSMNIRDEASLVEGNSLIKKISSERDRINALLSFQIDTSVFEKTTPKEKFAYDSKSIENIPHSLAGEFKKTASKQAEYDWETYLDVVPKLLVEQNQILQSWPALMAEAARQEIFPKIASLPANKQEELFLKFMERVEQERKAVAKGEGIEIEASVKETDVPDDPRNLFI